MNRTNRLLAIFNTLLAAILILALVQFASSIAYAKPTTIVACAEKNTGALRIAYKSCTDKENYVTWGVTSSQSAAGLRICKSTNTGVLALRTSCTSKESKVSNNKQLIGKTGAPGKNGVTGLPGLQGAMGSVGAAGSGGVKGETGVNGAGGAAGSNGASGANGNDGSPGANGSPGTNGNIGTAGADGSDGPAGSNGVDGEDGAPGAPGAKGDTGASGTGGVAGEGCSLTILDPDGKPEEMKGIFAWVLTAPESEMYVLGCDTNTEKQIVTNRPR